MTSPRTVAGRPRQVRVTSEIDAQTRIGELYMTTLLRAQLRLAGRVVLAVLLLVGGVPLAFCWFPELDDVRVAGVPLAWLLLGVLRLPAAGPPRLALRPRRRAQRAGLRRHGRAVSVEATA